MQFLQPVPQPLQPLQAQRIKPPFTVDSSLKILDKLSRIFLLLEKFLDATGFLGKKFHQGCDFANHAHAFTA